MYENLTYRPSLANVTAPAETGRSPFKRQVGEALARSEPPARVITNLAGKMAYYAGPRTHVVDLLGLTDRHNSKYGDTWYPRYGRSDFAATFSRPFDVLVTNSAGDLIQLVWYWQAHPGAEGRYFLLSSPKWLRVSFYVVVDAQSPVARVLEDLCGCVPELLTQERAMNLLRN
jgi:hypothetical protein